MSSFTKALRDCGRCIEEGDFLEALFRKAIEECGVVLPSGVSGLEPFGDLSSQQQSSLKIVREAAIQLSAADKAILLLRDQCHLPFERMASILNINSREARSSCMAARERLRAAVQAILTKPGKAHGV